MPNASASQRLESLWPLGRIEEKDAANIRPAASQAGRATKGQRQTLPQILKIQLPQPLGDTNTPVQTRGSQTRDSPHRMKSIGMPRLEQQRRRPNARKSGARTGYQKDAGIREGAFPFHTIELFGRGLVYGRLANALMRFAAFGLPRPVTKS